MRGYAAWSLGLAGEARAVEPLVALLDDPVWRVRAMAAAVLREIGSPAAADALAEALRDPAWQVRVEAVAYFRDRPDDLLTINVCAGEGWEVLCPFLGFDTIPVEAFPWVNKRRAPDGVKL